MVNRNQIQNKNNSSGILLLAKQSGETSFSSLTAVKRALDTGKVGHTGTLDSFADGLLVVLTGSLTRLVPHITNFSKTYLALIEFGKETDTLDPTGNVIREGTVPSEGEVMKALEFFKGEIRRKRLEVDFNIAIRQIRVFDFPHDVKARNPRQRNQQNVVGFGETRYSARASDVIQIRRFQRTVLPFGLNDADHP